MGLMTMYQRWAASILSYDGNLSLSLMLGGHVMQKISCQKHLIAVPYCLCKCQHKMLNRKTWILRHLACQLSCTAVAKLNQLAAIDLNDPLQTCG